MKRTAELRFPAFARISNPKLARFSELLRRVRGTLVLAQSQIQKIKVRAYWEIGPTQLSQRCDN